MCVGARATAVATVRLMAHDSCVCRWNHHRKLPKLPPPEVPAGSRRLSMVLRSAGKQSNSGKSKASKRKKKQKKKKKHKKSVRSPRGADGTGAAVFGDDLAAAIDAAVDDHLAARSASEGSETNASPRTRQRGGNGVAKGPREVMNPVWNT